MDNSNKTERKGGGDLHLHTILSDGSDTPEEIVNKAAKLGLEVISITDHDTIEGVAKAVDIGLQLGIKVIPGVELSCTYGKKDIHILGYFIDYKNESLCKILRDVSKTRIKRMIGMIKKLNALGVEIDRENFFGETNATSVGRLHMAHYLVKNKLVGSVYEAFERYIGDGKPAYIEVNAFTLEEGISLITNNGGLAVLAHPGKINCDKLIPKMIKMGLSGIEVFHSGHTRDKIIKYLKIAEKRGLLVTGGSDCHGSRKLEHLMGKIRLSVRRIVQLECAFLKNRELHRLTCK